jgi:hypothetical protein
MMMSIIMMSMSNTSGGCVVGGGMGGFSVSYFRGIYDTSIMTQGSGCVMVSSRVMSSVDGCYDTMSEDSMVGESSMGGSSMGGVAVCGVVGGFSVSYFRGIYDVSVSSQRGSSMGVSTMSVGSMSITTIVGGMYWYEGSVGNESMGGYESMSSMISMGGCVVGGKVGGFSVSNFRGVYDATVMGQGSGTMGVHAMGGISMPISGVGGCCCDASQSYNLQ